MNHTDQVLNLLKTQVSNISEVEDIEATAREVASRWVAPSSSGRQSTNGLIYGLVQSGKTGVLTTTGAVGADEGYKVIIILTSDIDPLYEQTLARASEAFPGMDILGKTDLRDHESFSARLKSSVCAVVMTKNSAHLGTLIENLKRASIREFSCLLIDDEADQASLNTNAQRGSASASKINELIENVRSFFDRNTYLQVTATPQALFLQTQDHAFRPKFTVLSHPGADYVGGDDFFSGDRRLVREFPISDIALLAPGNQPAPSTSLPASLQRALDTFMIAATYKRQQDHQNCAFLCHVSTKTSDHKHIVELLHKYKADLASSLKSGEPAVKDRFGRAYEDIAETHPSIREMDFDELLKLIAFFAPGISVKLVNGQSDEDVVVRSPYSLFVGGNKLGRGVTIRNLLVSYYGRNPRSPQADTVLQHARMYGYRRRDIGILRLFLPPELHKVFIAINSMERSLRELIAVQANEDFRGLYVEGNLKPTRKSVLVPGAVGVYTAGASYNPAQIRRCEGDSKNLQKIDQMLAHIDSQKSSEMSVSDMKSLLQMIVPDELEMEHVWDSMAIAECIEQCANIIGSQFGVVYVDRDRDLVERRRETQGILTGGEVSRVRSDLPSIFMIRTAAKPGRPAAWWPQVRFPAGRYAFAFAI